MSATPVYTFPAVRGIQARREYFVSMCPLRLVPRIFALDDERLSPDQRSQRTLANHRLPEIARYMIDNKDDYVFSALTCSIDADITFEPLDGAAEQKLGRLSVPGDARFIINDGQHRRAAIEQALKERPELGDETIAVVFFLDLGLERCQQMFADLNRHAIRPSASIGVLYDHRDVVARLTRRVVFETEVFGEMVELERSRPSSTSGKLFTLGAIHNGVKALLRGLRFADEDAAARTLVSFWNVAADQFDEWWWVRDHEVSPDEVRRQYIHTHALFLHALGVAGDALLRAHPEDWETRLEALRDLDYRRSNTSLWEGRAMLGGRLSKSAKNVTLTANVLKSTIGLDLTAEEQALEKALAKDKDVVA